MHTRLVVTSALPYANGPLHFGHLAGAYLPADIYTRYRRLRGTEVVHVCGSDEHGVAIMLNAEKQGIPYKEYVDRYHAEHAALFKSYGVEFSIFGRTSSDGHAKNSQAFFTELKKKGHIEAGEEEQPYCKNCERFLPDRYLGGIHAKCGYKDARGDECPSCGAWLSLGDLTDLFCRICKDKQVEIRVERQYFLLLDHFAGELKRWLSTRTDWKTNITEYALSLIDKGLPKRAITRNLDWGIPVPGEDTSKKLYVWFEAPIGYYSNLEKWCSDHKQPFNEWFSHETPVMHFIGKDNIVFHTIVWPAMLLGMGYALPANVPANMYLQLEGRKFSKSDGWYLDAQGFVAKFGVDRVRYYLTRIIPEWNDTNFQAEAFKNLVNGELVNNLANLFNRSLSMLEKNFGGEVTVVHEPCPELEAKLTEYQQLMDEFKFTEAMSVILSAGTQLNLYLQNTAPWTLVKNGKMQEARDALSFVASHGLRIAAMMAPFLPHYTAKLATKYGLKEDIFASIAKQHYTLKALPSALRLDATVDIKLPRVEDADLTALRAEMEGYKAQV